jgi:hypothetical protein
VSSPGKPRGRVLVLAALSAAAFAYAAIRAVRVPIIHDEAITYFLFVSGRWAGALDPRLPFAENNHYLNSILSAASWKALGGGELALRLPNLLAYSLYLAATASLALRQRTAALSVAAFLLLNASAFSVEFFSLSRGYGLGLAFLASGVAFLVGALERPGHGTIPASLGVLCLGLAACAHLAFLPPLAACVIAGLTREARRVFPGPRPPDPGRPPDASLMIPLGVSVPFLLVLVPYSMELSRRGRFFMGGVRGLWSDTAVSLLAVLRNLPPDVAPRVPLLEAALAAVLVLLAAAVLVRPGRLSPLSLVPTTLLAVTAAGIELAGRLLGARYPVERAALPVQFLFLGATTGIAGDWIERRRTGWKAASAALLVSASLAVVAFATAAGTTHTLLWRYDADNPKMLEDLDRARRERGIDRPVRLGISWLMEPSINYYRVRRKLDWLLPVNRSGLAARDPDFFYFTPKDEPIARSLDLVPLADYPVSGNRLAARGQARAGTSALTGVSQP